MNFFSLHLYTNILKINNVTDKDFIVFKNGVVVCGIKETKLAVCGVKMTASVKSYIQKYGGTIVCGTQKSPKWYLGKLNISRHWPSIAVGWGINRVNNVKKDCRATGLPTFYVYVKYDKNL